MAHSRWQRAEWRPRRRLTPALGKVMPDEQSANPYYGRAVYRIVWGVFGLFLTCVGILVVLFGVVGLPIRIGAGLLITLFGANAVWSSILSKPSWAARFMLFI